ncbi:MAG: hypothetical protein KJZ86_19650 [Caldilineaceae bacterium]|nr:hypothetical protein [Caldilineaceae bacterium]HRJ41600.1 hypothetical protein [Caldilineaceae bacterium]
MSSTKQNSRSFPGRRVYVLRIWQISSGQGWRYQLQDVTKGDTCAFTDDQSLLAYIRSELAVCEEIRAGFGLR